MFACSPDGRPFYKRAMISAVQGRAYGVGVRLAGGTAGPGFFVAITVGPAAVFAFPWLGRGDR